MSENGHITIRTYLVVYAALLVMLVVTVAAAFLHLGSFALVVAMGIAGFKALLVVLYFMHVCYSSALTKFFVGAAFFWLAILFVFTFSDYLSRGWLPMSRGWTEHPVRHQP